MKMDFSEIFLSKGVNYLSDDIPLSASMKYFDLKADDDMILLGSFVSSELIEVSMLVDHYSKPALHTWSVTDDRIDSIWISPDHARMLKTMQDMDVVRSIVRADGIMKHFLSGYLISDPGFYCTLTLTAQTAYALDKYADDEIRSKFLHRYLDPQDPWYGATYYTEIQGGSDLASNRATAVLGDDGWKINGMDKYFASNGGIADGAIVTARPQGADPGVRGISVFFVPAKRPDGTLNYNVRKLKDKLGTVSVPTGEVELSDSDAYLLGDSRYGIYYALEILMISRIDDALSAIGIARKALWESYLYAGRRQAFGKRIIEQPLMRRDFLEMDADLNGSLVVSLLAAKSFALASDQRPPYDDSYHIARVYSHISKNMASWTSDYVTRYCMEVFGGKGFLLEFPIEKFHRDSIVTSIWEGTSNIQALDLLDLLRKKKLHTNIRADLISMVATIADVELRRLLTDSLNSEFDLIDEWVKGENSEVRAKDILNRLGNSIAMTYLFAISEKYPTQMPLQTAKIYYNRHFKETWDPASLFEKDTAIAWMQP